MLSNELFFKPETIKTMEKYNANVKSFMAKYDEIKANHRGEFVAVYNGSNVEADKDRDKLLGRVREKVDVMDSVFIKYIPKTDHLLAV